MPYVPFIGPLFVTPGLAGRPTLSLVDCTLGECISDDVGELRANGFPH